MDSAQIAELMWKCIADAATAGQRAITMYLAILAGITGYLLNVTLQKDVKLIIFYVFLCVSAFFVIAITSLFYGIWMGLREITTAATSTDNVSAYRIFAQFVRRGRNVGLVMFICAGGALAGVLTGLTLSVK
jgi:hypothetical protein